VYLKRKIGVLTTCKVIKYKAKKLAPSQSIMWHQFEAMQKNRFSLHQRTSLCQKLRAEFKEKLPAFQQHVTRLDK
jgi:hypothetical protein